MSPNLRLHPISLSQAHSPARAMPRGPSALSTSPLLTAPHKLQGSGPLVLTEEEKRTLVAEGYPIPTKLPLTKSEEKALKKIRRKIKNKISAQESRRKKKEYMDSLEKKVESCSTENLELRKKVEVLENTNRTLLQQLQKLQTLVMGKVSRTCKLAGTQTGTCLMVSFPKGLPPLASPPFPDSPTLKMLTMNEARETIHPVPRLPLVSSFQGHK